MNMFLHTPKLCTHVKNDTNARAQGPTNVLKNMLTQHDYQSVSTRLHAVSKVPHSKELTHSHCLETIVKCLSCILIALRGLVYMYIGCAVLLCLVVCLTLLASFFLPSHLSLKHVHINAHIIHMDAELIRNDAK